MNVSEAVRSDTQWGAVSGESTLDPTQSASSIFQAGRGDCPHKRAHQRLNVKPLIALIRTGGLAGRQPSFTIQLDSF